jgi:hypothetical protein
MALAMRPVMARAMYAHVQESGQVQKNKKEFEIGFLFFYFLEELVRPDMALAMRPGMALEMRPDMCGLWRGWELP